jgi:hypothetical protein
MPFNCRIFLRQIAVSHELSRVIVVLDAPIFDQSHLVYDWLGQTRPGIPADRHDLACISQHNNKALLSIVRRGRGPLASAMGSSQPTPT